MFESISIHSCDRQPIFSKWLYGDTRFQKTRGSFCQTLAKLFVFTLNHIEQRPWKFQDHQGSWNVQEKVMGRCLEHKSNLSIAMTIQNIMLHLNLITQEYSIFFLRRESQIKVTKKWWDDHNQQKQTRKGGSQILNHIYCMKTMG